MTTMRNTLNIKTDKKQADKKNVASSLEHKYFNF